MEQYFKIALREAFKASKKNEVPVGAVIVKNGKVIAKAHNNRQKKGNVLGHAEVLCILKAEKKINDWRLNGCDLYVTLEPCKMCSDIIIESRIDHVFYIEKQNFQQNKQEKINFIQTNVSKSVYFNYKELLENFFKKLRNKL